MAHSIQEEVAQRDTSSYRPVRVAHRSLVAFIRRHPGITVIDEYASLLEELFQLRNPSTRMTGTNPEAVQAFIRKVTRSNPATHGTWFSYPWTNTLIHTLPAAMHQEVRTGRNPLLITKQEQRAFYDATVGVMGMSVGSHVALTIAMTGGARTIKLADRDVISGSNLNRIRAGFDVVGIPKVIAVARQIALINPYATVRVFNSGITDGNIARFIAGPPKLSLLVEEMDNPYFKFRSRELTKRHRIPLIMAADNGDGIITHVERYDTDRSLKPFNGIMGNLTAAKVKELDQRQLIGVIAQTVGAERSVERMQSSVLKVGRELYSWPQLGTAATLCGTVLAALARRIIVGDGDIRSGIYDVSLDAIFEHGYNSKERRRKRAARTAQFLAAVGIPKSRSTAKKKRS